MAAAVSTVYRKHFIPLESNPTVFTELIHLLGVSPSLAFTDVYSVNEPDLLAIVPRPVLALILIFPTTPTYEQQKQKEEATRAEYTGSGEDEDVLWFKQTINNACGFYGILHSVANGEAKSSIQPGSILSTLLQKCVPLAPEDRALALEGSEELEAAYATAAAQGDSAVPQNAEDDVDFHYVSFVKSHKNGHLYEMDGGSKGPVDLGPLLSEDEDLLSEAGLDIIRKYIGREEDGNINFSLLALGPNVEED